MDLAQQDQRAARSRRRVCILTSVHAARDTRVFHKEARALAAAGYQVSLIAQDDADACLDGVAIHALPISAARWRRPYLWWTILLRALRARADVYHIHDPELIPLALLLQTLSRRPVIYDAHEYYGDEVRTRLWIPAHLRNIAGWVTDRIEKAAARRLAAVVTVNQHMNARFLRVQPRSVAVHNYPPAEYFGEPMAGERGPLVVYVGVLTCDRGIETIYGTGRILKARFPALRIALAGSIDWSGVSATVPRDEAAWREHAGVDFLGMVPQREVPALLGSAIVGWIPFLATPNNVRSTPNKLLEYMAAGLPVVASDFGYMRAIVGEAQCGRLAADGAPAAHAGQIAWILEHPREAEIMGANGREAVLARYSWASEGKKLVDLYDNLSGIAPIRDYASGL
jgi:glycosyltransferase involved in cell wall biosynthesis